MAKSKTTLASFAALLVALAVIAAICSPTATAARVLSVEDRAELQAAMMSSGGASLYNILLQGLPASGRLGGRCYNQLCGPLLQCNENCYCASIDIGGLVGFCKGACASC